jgi:hypothetical protein
MGTLAASGGGGQVNLSTAQAGNGQSTNSVLRRFDTVPRAAAIRVVTAAGATPTCTYLLEGSADGVNWFPVPYVDSATPGTLSGGTFTITAAGTAWKFIPADQPWTFLRLTYSANTNVTNTVDAWVY